MVSLKLPEKRDHWPWPPLAVASLLGVLFLNGKPEWEEWQVGLSLAALFFIWLAGRPYRGLRAWAMRLLVIPGAAFSIHMALSGDLACVGGLLFAALFWRYAQTGTVSSGFYMRWAALGLLLVGLGMGRSGEEGASVGLALALLCWQTSRPKGLSGVFLSGWFAFLFGMMAGEFALLGKDDWEGFLYFSGGFALLSAILKVRDVVKQRK